MELFQDLILKLNCIRDIICYTIQKHNTLSQFVFYEYTSTIYTAIIYEYYIDV